MRLADVMRTAGLLALSAGLAIAGGADVPKELQPQLFSFDKAKATVAEALDELATQTGNRVVDRRRSKSSSPLRLYFRGATFWQALDSIAKESGGGVSLYEADGQIALVDRRSLKIA